MTLPDTIDSEEQLEELLTNPSEALVSACRQWTDPLIVLGAGGKMGPSLAVLARRAIERAGVDVRVIAVSRFNDAASRDYLHARGVETQRADVFERKQLDALPQSSNVVYLVGMKFGTSSDPLPTWATNTIAPVHACERFAGARIVALSTGNIYPLCGIASGGAVETEALTPIGEYPNAAVARERIFQYYAAQQATPIVLMRLNYAHDLHYGVLTDIAGKVWRGEAIDVTMGHFNAIWQGDANDMILRSFSLCSSPANAINMTSPEIFSVRSVAQQLGQRLGRQPQLVGKEAPTALLSNTDRMQDQLGAPRVGLESMLTWIAHWTQQGGSTHNKPTHFQTRDGKF
jgi:hypothetical protein